MRKAKGFFYETILTNRGVNMNKIKTLLIITSIIMSLCGCNARKTHDNTAGTHSPEPTIENHNNGNGTGSVTNDVTNAVGDTAKGAANAVGDVTQGAANAVGDAANAVKNVGENTANAVNNMGNNTKK